MFGNDQNCIFFLIFILSFVSELYHPSSPSNNRIAVATPLAGMLVAGYVVLVFPEDTATNSLFYGMFDTLDKAQDWAELLSGIVTIHPVYQTTHNRG